MSPEEFGNFLAFIGEGGLVVALLLLLMVGGMEVIRLSRGEEKR